MRRLLRLVVLAAGVAGAVAAIRALRRDVDPLPSPPTAPMGDPWPPLRGEGAASTTAPSAPASPEPEVVATEPVVAPAPTPDAAAWVEPGADGECPDGYPIKAKLSSKIFHAPGQFNYDRTTPDRCYATAAAAESDGLRQAKR